MLINLTDKGAPGHLDVDVCIVGGGPAGISIAGELAGTGRSVAVLEGGFLEPDASTQYLNLGWVRGTMAEKYPFYLSSSRLRMFGGSQMLWGGWCTPLTELDLAPRDWVRDSGWPLSMAQLAPYYRRAAEICGLHPSTASPVAERRVIGDELTESVYYFAHGRRTAKEALATKLIEAENVQVCLGANVTAVCCDPTRTCVQSIRAHTLGNEELTVSATHFILAAGGIENARLLLANHLGNGQAGRFFMEHPHVLAGSVQLPDKAKWARYLEQLDLQLDHGVMFALRLPAETQRRHGLLNAAVQLWQDESSLCKTQAGDMFHARLVIRAEQRPNRESRVTLAAEVDPLGVPVTQLNWELLPDDWSSICTTASLVASALTRHAGARVDLEICPDCPWPDFPANLDGHNPWGCHHMGTTRMSEDPGGGVVDLHTKVHGVQNLFVAGSSIFPTGGYANPTFTLIALALRTADHVKSLN